MKLPIRIRWYGPLGMRFEITDTVDVSREGLLVRCLEPCEVPTRVWIAFPYDAGPNAAIQPERGAIVVRATPDSPDGFRDSPDGFRVALRLETPAHAEPRAPASERRKEARVRLALPIFVRPAGAPWSEESMTRDLSRSGARFETSRVYDAGEDVLANLPWSKWAKGEVSGRVMRVELIENGPATGPARNVDAAVDHALTFVAVQWNLPKPT
ncbi:MAG TPA: PilZ domain-containing protein [Candidatus Cybelea sp.]|nr:PilZ domain-containing protein [Candidatus Cybelea sp.]